jgi:hypothetical protein
LVLSLTLLPAVADAQQGKGKPNPPATKPAPKPGKQVDPAQKAAKELVKEAQDALRAKKPFPRTTSDYFKTAEGEPPTEQQILGQLNRNLNGNPLVDAYAKWQLLSGAPATFSSERAEEAVKALVNAPALATMPGVVPDVQRKLQDAISRVRADRDGNLSPEDSQLISSINEQFANETSRVANDGKLLIDYRNELIKRIPSADDKQKTLLLKARLEDLWQRGAAGYATADVFKTLGAEIRTWAATADKDAIARMLAFVGEYASRQPLSVFDRAEWDVKKKQVVWKSRKAGIEPKELGKLQDDLREAQKNAVKF